MKAWVIDNKYCIYRVGPFHANDHYTCRHGKHYAKPCSYDGCPIKNPDASQSDVAPDVKRWCDNQDVVDGKKVCEYLGVEGSCTHLR